jgi:hypothetical protein
MGVLSKHYKLLITSILDILYIFCIVTTGDLTKLVTMHKTN